MLLRSHLHRLPIDLTVAIAALVLMASGRARPAAAHAVEMSVRETAAVEVRATFAGGTPMAAAQVTVYAPDRPTEPWLQGQTDGDGRFLFAPDPNRAGNWQVRVRQAGHGEIVSIAVSEDTGADVVDATRHYSPIQKIVIVGLGVWGAVGTALYFSRTPVKER